MLIISELIFTGAKEGIIFYICKILRISFLGTVLCEFSVYRQEREKPRG